MHAIGKQDGVHRGLRCGFCRHHGKQQHIGCCGFNTGGHGKQSIAIQGGVRWPNASGQPIVRAHGQTLGLRFVERGIGGHHPNAGVGTRHGNGRALTCQQSLLRIEQARAVGRAGPCQDLACGWIDHIAHGVASHHGAHLPWPHLHQGMANAAFHGAWQAKQLAHHGTCASAHIARQGRHHRTHGTGRHGFLIQRIVASRIAGSGVRPDFGVVAISHQGQVKQHRGGHDGHTAMACLKAQVALVQPTHHTAGGIQAKSTATRQQHRMHFVHQIGRVE